MGGKERKEGKGVTVNDVEGTVRNVKKPASDPRKDGNCGFVHFVDWLSGNQQEGNQ